jgi:hypothetical protein
VTEEHEELVRGEIRARFYYVRYPDPLPPTFWEDRVGELLYISDMGLDHLKSTIQLVEKDLRYLKESHRPKDVIAAIQPVAEAVLQNLRQEFKRKAAI